jgi:hypothetical protein
MLSAPPTRAACALIELDKRLARLRQRLRTGDPDLSADDLQTAIEKAERYRLELPHA